MAVFNENVRAITARIIALLVIPLTEVWRLFDPYRMIRPFWAMDMEILLQWFVKDVGDHLSNILLVLYSLFPKISPHDKAVWWGLLAYKLGETVHYMVNFKGGWFFLNYIFTLIVYLIALEIWKRKEK